MFKKKQETGKLKIWARPEMLVTFRAEIMPGRSREERTYKIAEVKNNGRVILHKFEGEHREGSFEPVRFERKTAK